MRPGKGKFLSRARQFSIVLGKKFVVGLRMIARRAFVGCLRALVDIAAISAAPLCRGRFFEDGSHVDIFEEDAVTFLMFHFNPGNLAEDAGNFVEPFLVSHPGCFGVKNGMLVVLAVSGRLQVGCCRTDDTGGIGSGYLDIAPFEEFKEALGVLLLIISRIGKYERYLFITIFFRLGREIRISHPRLRFPREACQQILFCQSSL